MSMPEKETGESRSARSAEVNHQHMLALGESRELYHRAFLADPKTDQDWRALSESFPDESSETKLEGIRNLIEAARNDKTGNTSYVLSQLFEMAYLNIDRYFLDQQSLT